MADGELASLVHGEQLLARGEIASALKLATLALAAEATRPAWHRLRGLALAASGRASEARPHLQRYAELEPREAEAWTNLGNACLDAGDAAAAVDAFRVGGDAGASGLPYLLGRGSALLGTGCCSEALPWLQRALALEPDAADVRLALGQCLAELERFEALDACLAGVDADALDFGQRTAFAWLSALAGRDEAAVTLYSRLIAEQPEARRPKVELALLLERMNRVQEAARLLGDGAGDPTPAATDAMDVLARARLARRLGRTAGAADALARAAEAERDPAMAAQLGYELARWHDPQDPDAAMAALSQAHANAAAALRQRHPDLRAEGVLDWLRERLCHPLPAPHVAAAGDPPDPVFLVGFPRSGTTMLEQMLERHPALQVLDERPAVERVIHAMRTSAGWNGGDLDAALAGLDFGHWSSLRARYRTEVARYRVPAGRLVDKYPLYLTRVPYIQRLFPRSDWLLLLRHPCDCVLSCHFQAFGLNGGALAFASLESTARTYAAVMGYWEEQRVLARPRVHVLRYEELVGGPEPALRQLMDALQLPMDPSQLAFPAAVAARTRRINTPSYAQVAEPVNANAVGRWRRYRAHFSDAVLEPLAPFAQRYGYALD
ncbi:MULTISPECIES: sulfotransferase [unclassified Luteimonas]|uniref:tetratricopeptide repeat-containing sulfotransferase family protein n=1 Tax=unclassified Luteimonas TaxID=2629088 RepID=UPI0018F0BDEE|nr:MULTISPECIES: sulfotransferase [unclassified Luteimonas]MBJ6977880.1 sulfotransferase [Luteimonas sp. MC1895]MBJ6984700.1 sulfotransferase [Luteimonas sp. MC1750]QQO04703.1 sulfotransferase [Luteimonas sp. MC1750]